MVNQPDIGRDMGRPRAGSAPTTTRRRPGRPGRCSRASVNKGPARRGEQVKRALDSPATGL